MCENLLLELKKRNHNVLAVSLYGDRTKITDRLLNSEIEVRFLNKKKGLDISIFEKLHRIIIEFRPDVIHTHLYALKYAAIARGWSKIPVIHTLHSIAEKECSHIDKKINRVLYNYFNVIPVSLSSDIQKSVYSLYGLHYSPVIYNGIDLRRCQEKDSYCLHDPIKIIHVGRFEDVKNHALIVQVAKRLRSRSICFELIGEGSLLDVIKGEVASMGLEDKFCFAGTTENVFPRLTSSDVFVLPSKFEGMPMTIIEAMGTGLPIIASNVGGVNEMIVNNESGVLIQPTSDDLYEAILRVLNDDSFREKIGRKAFDNSKKFSVENMALEYEKLYQSACK